MLPQPVGSGVRARGGDSELARDIVALEERLARVKRVRSGERMRWMIFAALTAFALAAGVATAVALFGG